MKIYVEWESQGAKDFTYLKNIEPKDIQVNNKLIAFGDKLVINLDSFVMYEVKEEIDS